MYWVPYKYSFGKKFHPLLKVCKLFLVYFLNHRPRNCQVTNYEMDSTSHQKVRNHRAILHTG